MKKILLSVFVVLVSAFAAPAGALVRIDLTDANSNPLPIALVNLSGATEEEKAIGRQIKELIRNNLKNSGLFNTIDDKAFLQSEESIQKQGPIFSQWRLLDTQAVMVGSVEIINDGSADKKLRVVYRLFDVYSEEQVTGRVYTATLKFWRHVGHRISDDIYKSLTGEEGYFATRIVFIAEEPTGRGYRAKKLCVMDQDGGNYQCLTSGRHLVLTPRFSPTAQKVIYMSYENNNPRLYLLDLVSGQQEILGDFEGLNSSPRFSPDGNTVAMTLTMGHAGNPEIYTMDLKTRKLRRLTIHRGIDTSPSFSPDGKHIVFNSDRGGTPALYIMDKDGNNVRRLTFGEGRYYAPAWSPRGDLIAFVKQHRGRFSIGVIDPQGEEERLLTDSYMDESPSWSPNGRVIIFARQKGDSTRIHTIDLTGYNERQLPTPTDATDPSWSPLLQ